MWKASQWSKSHGHHKDMNQLRNTNGFEDLLAQLALKYFNTEKPTRHLLIPHRQNLEAITSLPRILYKLQLRAKPREITRYVASA